MPRFIAALALLTLFALAACDTLSGPRTSDASLEQRIIDTEELVDLMSDEKKPAILVDVRSPEQYEAGHIPGALNLPLPAIRSGDARLADARALIVTGAGWGDILTSAGSKKLLALKYANVYDYRGGLELWKAEGRPVAEGSLRGEFPR